MIHQPWALRQTEPSMSHGRHGQNRAQQTFIYQLREIKDKALSCQRRSMTTRNLAPTACTLWRSRPTEASSYHGWMNRTGPFQIKPGKKGHKHGAEANRELFVASSNDGGKTFSANQLIAREVCPCCKTSLAIAPDGRIYVSWRQVLPGDLRHIAVASSSDQGKTFSSPVIVSDDRWTIAGCPVSGSSLSVSSDGTLQILWYSAGEAGPTGIYRSQSQDAGKSFAPRQLVAEGQAQGTPVLLPYLKGAIAIWQADLGSDAHVMTAYLGDKLACPYPTQ